MPSWNIQEFLEQLKLLVNIDSGSESHDGISQIADYFERQFQMLGYYGHRIEYGEAAGCSLEMRNFQGDDIDLLLLGHMDTVFPKGTAQDRPFRVENGMGYGPGVADMKAGLVSILFLAKRLYLEKRNLHICVALNGCEEIGSVCSADWIQSLSRKSRYCILFEPGRPGNIFVKERKGIEEYEVQFHGIAVHSGVEPEKGASAILEMSRWITELSSMSDYAHGLSVNVGIASGGHATNMVPDYAECRLEIRYMNPAARDFVQERIQKLQGQPFDKKVRAVVTKKSSCPPMQLTPNTENMISHLKNLCKKMNIAVDFISTGGSSDANFVSAAGAAVLDGCGPIGANLHSDKEYLEISSIEQRLELMYQLTICLFSM